MLHANRCLFSLFSMLAILQLGLAGLCLCFLLMILCVTKFLYRRISEYYVRYIFKWSPFSMLSFYVSSDTILFFLFLLFYTSNIIVLMPWFLVFLMLISVLFVNHVNALEIGSLQLSLYNACTPWLFCVALPMIVENNSEGVLVLFCILILSFIGFSTTRLSKYALLSLLPLAVVQNSGTTIVLLDYATCTSYITDGSICSITKSAYSIVTGNGVRISSLVGLRSYRSCELHNTTIEQAGGILYSIWTYIYSTAHSAWHTLIIGVDISSTKTTTMPFNYKQAIQCISESRDEYQGNELFSKYWKSRIWFTKLYTDCDERLQLKLPLNIVAQQNRSEYDILRESAGVLLQKPIAYQDAIYISSLEAYWNFREGFFDGKTPKLLHLLGERLFWRGDVLHGWFRYNKDIALAAITDYRSNRDIRMEYFKNGYTQYVMQHDIWNRTIEAFEETCMRAFAKVHGIELFSYKSARSAEWYRWHVNVDVMFLHLVSRSGEVGRVCVYIGDGLDNADSTRVRYSNFTKEVKNIQLEHDLCDN